MGSAPRQSRPTAGARDRSPDLGLSELVDQRGISRLSALPGVPGPGARPRLAHARRRHFGPDRLLPGASHPDRRLSDQWLAHIAARAAPLWSWLRALLGALPSRALGEPDGDRRDPRCDRRADVQRLDRLCRSLHRAGTGWRPVCAVGAEAIHRRLLGADAGEDLLQPLHGPCPGAGLCARSPARLDRAQPVGIGRRGRSPHRLHLGRARLGLWRLRTRRGASAPMAAAVL